jgi:hypothetical protein
MLAGVDNLSELRARSPPQNYAGPDFDASRFRAALLFKLF